jgi:hypothetical protein
MLNSRALSLIAVFLFGCLLIYFARDISEVLVRSLTSDSASAQAPILGEFSEVTSPAFLRPKSATQNIRPTARLPLRHLDQVRTEKSGQVKIQLKNKWTVIIKESSTVIFESYRPEKNDGPILMSVLRGDYFVSEVGTPGQLFVQKDKKIFSAQARPTGNTRVVELKDPLPKVGPESLPNAAPAITATPPANENKNAMPDKVKTGDEETLSSAYIENQLAQQAPAFRRCQLNSIRDNRVSVGNLLVSLTIASTGEVNQARLLQDDLQNEPLTQCVLSAVQRVRFKSFDGQPISLTYPIVFK